MVLCMKDSTAHALLTPAVHLLRGLGLGLALAFALVLAGLSREWRSAS